MQPKLIEAYGYPSEVHNIKTEDGYILEVHRIAAPGKQPVLLVHGMLDSSATWIMLGPGRALGNFHQIIAKSDFKRSKLYTLFDTLECILHKMADKTIAGKC